MRRAGTYRNGRAKLRRFLSAAFPFAACTALLPAGAAGAPPPVKPPQAAPAQTVPAQAAPNNINPTGHNVSLVVPLRENGPLGQVRITITKAGKIFISATDLINALSRIVRAENLAHLKSLADADGQIALSSVSQSGLTITYDPNSIELAAQIPVAARTAESLSFGMGTSAGAVEPDRSAPVGAFLNYRVGENYVISGPEAGKYRFLGDLELGGRLARTLSFENFATIDQGASQLFSRSASRLIYDMPVSALRITAGDLTTQTTAFQIDPQISGINVSHLISNFFPTLSTTSTSSQSVTLTRGSDVQIFVNNMPVSEIHLGPGTYNLRNLPLAQGANNMKAVITDDTGQRRVVDFSFFSDANLLSPGVAEYTGSFGILAPLGRDGPDYQTDEPAFSGFYRRGLSEQLTAGLDLQADKENQILGLDSTFGTRFGLFSLNLAGNHLKDGDNGAAVRFQYRFADQTNSLYFARTFDFSAEYHTLHFGTLDDINANNSEEAVFAASVNQPLTQDISFQFSGNYTKSRDAGQDTGGVSAFVTWQAPFETTLGAGATYQWAPKPLPGLQDVLGRGFSLAITLTHRFDESTIVDASADRFRQRVDFNRSPLNPVNDYFANGDFDHSAFGYTGNATGGYITNRGAIEGTYNTALNPDGSVASQQVGAFFDGSVDFAGGKLGIGRHIDDAFAIVDGDPSLKGRKVIVDSQFADQPVATSGPLGPAVVPINSYNKQILPYDVKDLPPGYDLGTGNFQVYPWYHAGYAFTVGSPYNVTALGHLLDADGQPLSLRIGEAVSLTDHKAPHREVITNRTGRFAALGLSPGTWRITMSGGLSYDITITKKEGMLARFGTLKPGAGQTGGKP
jgi:outer membrane usher protein